MTILVVGLSHHTAPVEVLERAALGHDTVRKLLDEVRTTVHLSEAVAVVTCNRVEIYADAATFHGGVEEIGRLLSRHVDVGLDELTRYLYVHYDDRAVLHLFYVTCGLDSMVVGESQILGQVRTALRAAQDHGTAGRTLGALAQQALRVGKRARTETGIDRAGRSLVTAGLDEAERTLGPVTGLAAVVVGAGSMSALAATLLSRAGIDHLVVANRTFAHGERVAAAVGAEAVPLSGLPDAMAGADLVITCTGAVGHVISREDLVRVQQARDGRPFVVVDLALPRDVAPDAHDVPGVTVVDLETLARALEATQHAADVEATRSIVADEVVAFLGWQRAASVAPTVVALRDMADGVVRSELTRLAGRLPQLGDKERAEIEQTVHRVVDKVLHDPTVRVKQLAGEPGGEGYADALSKLFGLDQAAVDAVTQVHIEERPS